MEQKKAIITDDILKTKAKQLWEALPQYNDIEEPNKVFPSKSAMIAEGTSPT